MSSNVEINGERERESNGNGNACVLDHLRERDIFHVETVEID